MQQSCCPPTEIQGARLRVPVPLESEAGSVAKSLPEIDEGLSSSRVRSRSFLRAIEMPENTLEEHEKKR
jgi:hypothetical protein